MMDIINVVKNIDDIWVSIDIYYNIYNKYSK